MDGKNLIRGPVFVVLLIVEQLHRRFQFDYVGGTVANSAFQKALVFEPVTFSVLANKMFQS